MLRKSILWLTLFISSFVVAQDSRELKALKKDMPPDAALIIERIVGCNHWSGQESANKERAEQINKAVTQLRCDTLEQDQAKLLKLYQNNYEVKMRIQDAQSVF